VTDCVCFLLLVLVCVREVNKRFGSSEVLLSSDHGLDSVVHVLNEVDFGATETSQVGDVEDAVVSLGVLSVRTTNLNVVLVGNGLELVLVLCKLGQLDVHRSAHASSQVGRARSDVTEMLVVGKLGNLFDLGGGSGETFKDLSDVGAHLHGDDAELILFVDPHEEGLVVVVENTTRLGPFSFEAARLQVLVTALEKEVICNQLFPFLFSHGAERVVLALELAFELRQGCDHLLLNFATLLRRASSSEWVVRQVSGDTNACRVDHFVFVGGEVGAVELRVVHVGNVFGAGPMSVILLNDLVKEGRESVVPLVATCVDANARVGPFAARENALLERVSKTVFLVLAGFPDVAGEGLGEQ